MTQITRLIVVRHGETDFTSEKRYCGFSDPRLNARGRKQAERVGARLQDFAIDRVYASDLARAYETAKIACPLSSAVRSADFREMDFGKIEGLTYADCLKQYPDIYSRWLADPQNVVLPDGESWHEFFRRIMRGLSELLSMHQQETIALFTHSGPIRVVLCQIKNGPATEFWTLSQDNGAINIVDFSLDGIPTLVRENDTAHLSLNKDTML
jgi:broad specificity phosphatase PhoE